MVSSLQSLFVDYEEGFMESTAFTMGGAIGSEMNILWEKYGFEIYEILNSDLSEKEKISQMLVYGPLNQKIGRKQ